MRKQITLFVAAALLGSAGYAGASVSCDELARFSMDMTGYAINGYFTKGRPSTVQGWFTFYALSDAGDTDVEVVSYNPATNNVRTLKLRRLH
jgi:hypothetical protein